jgi:UDP-N-acetylglucosamine 2-epimerase (non-hydrolysing)/GDP/UDP-N,N'-diacetylbacillosamine 2-epimerase (hydrolysing)
MSERRKIAVFTGNRSEYGLQFPVLRAIAADPRLEYCLLAGGAHLSQEFGNTIAEIEQDGFKVYGQVTIEGTHGSPAYTPQCIGSGILSVSEILTEVRPQFLVVYGDRFESFSALIAATQMNVAVAHIEGGDYTEGGALDDSVRHAMTKLAHLHFTTNEQSAERVRRLGEEPWRVFNVGLPSLDMAATGCHAAPEELVAEFHFDLARPVLLFCQHSITTEVDELEQQIAPSLLALQQLRGEGYQIVITFPNNDAGGRIIIEKLQRFCDANPGVWLIPSLGRRRFHGMLNLIGRVGRGAVLGNSSAGIKETAAFACPTVNIGTRQQGRLRASNVLDVPYDTGAIVEAVRRCASNEQFRETCRTCENPYGRGDAGKQIAEVLATIPIDRRLMQKRLIF